MIFNALTLSAGAAAATAILMADDPAVNAAILIAAVLGAALSILIDRSK